LSWSIWVIWKKKKKSRYRPRFSFLIWATISLTISTTIYNLNLNSFECHTQMHTNFLSKENLDLLTETSSQFEILGTGKVQIGVLIIHPIPRVNLIWFELNLTWYNSKINKPDIIFFFTRMGRIRFGFGSIRPYLINCVFSNIFLI
jgi:hypothetical protein